MIMTIQISFSDSSAPQALRKPFDVDGVVCGANHAIHIKQGRATACGEEAWVVTNNH